MKRTSLDILSILIGRSLIGIGGLVTEFIDRLRALVVKARERFATPAEIIGIARAKLHEFEPMLAEHLSDSTLAAWIGGFDSVARLFPKWLQDEFITGIRGFEPPSEPPKVNLFQMFGDEPRLRLPIIENAAQRLMERRILTRDQFDAASEQMQQEAFTVAGDLGEKTIDRLRGFLVEDLYEGTSLDGFEKRLKEHFETSPIAPAHLETVYRTNIQAALRDGKETLRSNPIVAATFPYQEYIPIHDGRVRHEHEELGHLGLNGTGIYRSDDPMWSSFTPPWDFNCILPDVQIQGSFDTGIRSLYSGQAIKVTTLSGNSITLTPNHPVLTKAGMIPAKLLKIGDDLLRRNRFVEFASHPDDAFVSAYKQDAPLTCEQVFGALENMGLFARMPLRSKDLHGDLQFWDCNVDVVTIDGKLRNAIEGFGNRRPDAVFVSLDFDQRSLAGGGMLSGSPWRPFVSLDGRSSLGLGHFGPTSLTALASVPDRHTSFMQMIPDSLVDAAKSIRYFNRARSRLVHSAYGADIKSGYSSGGLVDASILQDKAKFAIADTEFFHDFADGCSATVSLDNIVDVEVFNYSGHVYDFQSATGLIIANGIIISNCRCGTRLLTLEAAAAAGVKEAQEWLRTGRSPLQPEYRLAHIPFDPKPGFGSRGRVGVLV